MTRYFQVFLSDEGLSSAAESTKRAKHAPDEIWYCREYWCGDSRDGQYANGDGYHYFEMKGEGLVLRAFEFYETDEGEEHVCEVPELVGLNWFEYFGFEDDELLEKIPSHEFVHVESLMSRPAP